MRLIAPSLILACLAPPMAGQVSSRRDSAEAAVLRAIIAVEAKDPAVVVQVTTGRDAVCLVAMRSDPCAVSRQPPFIGATADYDAMNRAQDSLPAGVIQLLGRRAVNVSATNAATTCFAPDWLQFSRVGFDSTMTHAVVASAIGRGRAPIPGCGTIRGSTHALSRRPDGSWQIIATFGEWIG